MSNPLKNVVAGKWRRRAYIALGTIGSLIAATFVGLTAAQIEAPTWLIFISAFFGALTGPAWSVPASNVSKSEL